MIYTNNNTLSLSQVNGFKVQMQASNPRHLMNDLTEAGKANVSPADKSVSSFGEAMTQAVKKVNQAQHTADAKVNQWAINPESIDIHDVPLLWQKLNRH